LDCEDVPDLAVGENIACEILHKLMNSDFCLAPFEFDDFSGLYMGIKRSPLAAPVGAYGWLASDLASL
jgi:hypothetical protein